MSADKTGIRLKITLAFLLLLTAYCLLPAAIGASDSDKVIKAIEVEGLSRIKDDELIDMICLRVGDTVDREAVKKGIKRAFKKGIFQDIKVISESYEGGLKLRYVAEETPFIGKINIIGNELIPIRKIKEAFI